MTDRTVTFSALDESAMRRLAESIAFVLRPGDTVALSGEVGAGKSTLARQLIRAAQATGIEDIPSPTFTLVQSYETARFPIAHVDLYRLSSSSDLEELGIEHALRTGIALIEWPERAGHRLPGPRLDLRLEETKLADGREARALALTPHDTWIERLQRLIEIDAFLQVAGWGASDVSLAYLQGDASPRRYARLTRPTGETAILMDSPRQPDGPAIRDGKPYSRIAHLAEDVGAFVAVASALREAGVSVPALLAQDLPRGLLLIEDFGDRVFGREVALDPARQAPLWQSATDLLVSLRAHSPLDRIALPDGTHYEVSRYDRQAMAIETELLVDWMWPLMLRAPVPQPIRDQFTALWNMNFDCLLTLPQAWVLRDFHSPNLIELPGRAGIRGVGVIDFQDAMRGPAAYDVVSLLQDARLDVPAELEARLFDHYCAAVQARETVFELDDFRFAYAALGAQRCTKILGIFARLAVRDGKPTYLAHIPRLWGYLQRNLEHPALAPLRAWYDEHFPGPLRDRPTLV